LIDEYAGLADRNRYYTRNRYYGDAVNDYAKRYGCYPYNNTNSTLANGTSPASQATPATS